MLDILVLFRPGLILVVLIILALVAVAATTGA